MSFEPFAMERWQSTWENRVRFNLSESGVHPLTVAGLLALAGAKRLGGIETPDAFEQSLPPQHRVQAGDAAAETVRQARNARAWPVHANSTSAG